jgi:parallel beta-helix repeat protein
MSKLNFQVVLMGIFLVLAGTVQASAQCGTTITTSTTLTADLGPCPADGLDIGEAPGPLTLNLNGHTIRGSGASIGVQVGPVANGVIIKGPGTIANFATGIGAGGGFGDILIYDLTIRGTQSGIGIGRQPGTVRVLNNVIAGGQGGQIGISVLEDQFAYVYKNTISEYTTAVEIPFESSAVVDENLITLNQTGIYLPISTFGVPAYCIRGNIVTFNQGTGIQVGSTAAANSLEVLPQALPTVQPCGTIEDNTVTFNGGNGIAVTNEISAQVLDNEVSFNKVDGISIIGGGSSQVSGNRVQNNGTDILWDGTGAPCGRQNIFNTSSGTLPPCD